MNLKTLLSNQLEPRGIKLVPVGLIDKKVINRRKIGPVTRMLSDLYHQIVLGEMAKYDRWLTPVH